MGANFGYDKSEVINLYLPSNTPDCIPIPIDDMSLAFSLSIRNKILWYILHNKKKMYKKIKIPKRNGKIRVLHSPNDKFKKFLSRLLVRYLNPLQERLGDHVTAYRTSRCITDAIRMHVPKCPICDNAPKHPKQHNCPKHGTFIHMDLKDFFSSTSAAYIRRYFSHLGFSYYVSSLLAGILTIKDFRDRKGYLHSGVPQGSPTSGAICNLVADHRLDHKIIKYLEGLNTSMALDGEYKWVYSRYSDDLTLTCGKRLTTLEVDSTLRDLTDIINSAGYTVNKRKTKVVLHYHKRKTLGIVFSEKVNVDKSAYHKMRSILHNCELNGFTVEGYKSGKESADEFKTWIEGTINWYGQINPVKGIYLANKYDLAIEKWKGINE